MHLHFDDDFLEGCVFACTSGRRKGMAPLLVARFNAEREKLYSTLDPDERNAGFFRLHLKWFREWGLEEFLAKMVAEFPELPRGLKLLAFRKARGKQDEAAELYVNPETGRHGVVAFRCEQFADDAALTRFLRHEFTHLHDMVAPAFGYAPALHAPGITATQHRLARERYRLLWDITIDSRLARAGHGINTTREQYQPRFDGAYAFWPEARRREVFDSLWNDAQPTHAKLAALAADPRDLAHAAGSLPGAACPLCGFPTFHWATVEQFAPDMIERITGKFPTWTPHQSACLRCHETYEALAKKLRLPDGGRVIRIGGETELFARGVRQACDAPSCIDAGQDARAGAMQSCSHQNHHGSSELQTPRCQQARRAGRRAFSRDRRACRFTQVGRGPGGHRDISALAIDRETVRGNFQSRVEPQPDGSWITYFWRDDTED